MYRLISSAPSRALAFYCLLAACKGDKGSDDSASPSDTAETGQPDTAETGDSAETGDTGTGETADTAETGEPVARDPFGDVVDRFSPGEGAGYGQDDYPDVVLGSPEGGGESGSLDVLSLGREGEIVIEFDDIGLIDGEGPDLLVFENPFPGWYELGHVAVSEDGETWHEWSCDPEGEGYPGCAGVGLVYATSTNGVDATDPDAAGGDAFDLADLGLSEARFVRIRDAGTSSYDGVSGGFDLDAVAVVNGQDL